MAKNIIKQIIVTVLIGIAIVLVLAIILYKYIPSNQKVPSKVSEYKTPENVASEITENLTAEEIEPLNRTFEITDSDLYLYKRSQSYNPGKSDPFSEYTVESTNETNSSSDVKGKGASSGSTTTDKNVTDNYYKAANVSGGSK